MKDNEFYSLDKKGGLDLKRENSEDKYVCIDWRNSSMADTKRIAGKNLHFIRLQEFERL